MAYGEIKVVSLSDADAVTVTDTNNPKLNSVGGKGYPATKSASGATTYPASFLVESGSGSSTTTGSSSTVVAKSEGITQASESLLSCANDLSNVLSKLSEVSTSISSNMSGFSQVDQIIKTLNNVIANKDNIVSKIKEFANYLTTVVTTGYDSFINSLGEMNLDTSSLSSIDSLFGGGSVGSNVYNYSTLGGVGGSIFSLMMDATGNSNQGDGTTYTQQDAYTGGPSSGARGTIRTKSSS